MCHNKFSWQRINIKMAKRSCVFTIELKEKYKFLRSTKDNSRVFCEFCNNEFSIASRGGAEIESHCKTDKHKKALSSVASSIPVTQFFQKSNTVNMEMAAREGMWVYHSIKANHSFASNDCSSKIIKTVFGMPKFSCARTKSERIATHVFAPYIQNEIQSQLGQCNFISLSTDASNHGAVKMFPVIVRYFSVSSGVNVKLLNFTAEKGETSEIIYNLLESTSKSYNILEKTIAFCADNAPVNFGGITRGGSNNVLHRLQQVKPNIIGIGCVAHIVHNALEDGCNVLPFDIECIVVKIYSHFYRYTVRTAKLEEFCESVQIEYQKLLGYSKTRFLALSSSVASIIRIFDALQEYFDEWEKTPPILRQFFGDKKSKLWLYFIFAEVNKHIFHKF